MWFIRLRKKLVKFILFTIKNVNKKKCLFLGTPAHKNLGDHAIVYAQYKYIRDNFAGCQIFEMSKLEYETYRRIVSIMTSRKSLIVVDGGGNLGTLWPGEDNCIRDIVKRFSHNPLIVFPQTAYYDESDDGKRLYDDTVKLINSRNKIRFMFRDKRSYDLFKDHVSSEKIVLTPDIVTYVDDANRKGNECRKNKVGICFRDDKETIMGTKAKEKIVETVKSEGYEIVDITTISPINIHSDCREATVKKKWDEFAQCQFVITDRLHGMIFSAITGTKCLAFDNISGKVAGGYSWLEPLQYIKYCPDYDKLDDLVEMMRDEKYYDYSREKVVNEYFKPISEFISVNCR